MMKNNLKGVIFVATFFVIVFLAAFMNNPDYPAYAISGESSVGTWMSGVLLVICAATSLMFGMQQQQWQWYLFTAFFLLLAADERFMFHEQIKEHLIFADHTRSRWVYELPVLTGALAGVFIAILLWRLLRGTSRGLLISAVLFGGVSTVMDVLTAGVLIEDVFKLLGELSLTCALLLAADCD